jgi:peptidoglycan/xylan/chitin deacetylase (PgdA/CDA1 family)
MSWSELAQLVEAGCSIGAHSITHPNMARLSCAEVLDEALQSRRLLSERIGLREAEITSFAFPGGRATRTACQALEPHFACACTDELGLVAAKTCLMALPRIDTYYLRHQRAAKLLPGRWFAAYVGAVSIPRRVRRSISDLMGDGVVRA